MKVNCCSAGAINCIGHEGNMLVFQDIRSSVLKPIYSVFKCVLITHHSLGPHHLS